MTFLLNKRLIIYGTYSPIDIDEVAKKANEAKNDKTKKKLLKRVEKLKCWQPMQQELLDLFPDAPYPNIIKQNFSKFVKYSHRILAFMESLPECTRGIRLFSIFPTKQDYIDTHVFLNEFGNARNAATDFISK